MEPVEELSKKSFEVVVHLDEKLKLNNDDSDESCEEDETGRPICNSWKGQNYPLHVLGFDSLFMKEVKTYQVPQILNLKMDPFCRVESNYPPEDSPLEEAFLLWQRSGFGEMLDFNQTKKPEDLAKTEEDSSSEEEEDYEESCSETELDIADYIKSQKMKKSRGLNLTNEKLIYDEEFDVVRNLHSNSISLTRYGGLPEDTIFGKGSCLFDQLSPDEKQMIKAIQDDNSEVKKSPLKIEKSFQGIGDAGDFAVS